MSADADALLLIGIMIVIAALVIGITLWSDIAYRRDDIYLPSAPSASLSRTAIPPLWTHAAPPRPFTVPEARRVMQVHLECSPDSCPRKREARDALIQAGVLVPAGRPR